MGGLTSHIEEFIKQMLENSEDGSLEIGRNELAQQFQCAPSQINYVLSTRFTPYKGYYIESRRGGAGYIRIMKLTIGESQSIETIINETIGDSLTKNRAYHIIRSLQEEEAIDQREADLMSHAIEDFSLGKVDLSKRNVIRADVLRAMLLALIRR